MAQPRQQSQPQLQPQAALQMLLPPAWKVDPAPSVRLRAQTFC
jgi:hypothetical protein